MSCSKSDKTEIDSTNPKVLLTNPIASTSVKPGDVLGVKALLSDNIKLKSYVIKVASTGVKQCKNVEDYSFDSSTDLDAYEKALPIIGGKQKSDLNFDIQISDRASYGDYIFSISVLDQSDNETKLSLEFEISRP